MRTVRRLAEASEVDTEKETLSAHIKAFAQEKQHWLTLLAKKKNRPFLKRHRVVRDEAVKLCYTSRHGTGQTLEACPHRGC